MRNKEELKNLNIGRIPPSNTDAENKILGAIMNTKGILEEVSDIITPEMFYDENNGFVYEAILSLTEKSNPVDITTVSAELTAMNRLDNVGGIIRLMNLCDSIVGYGNEEYYATIIKENYLKRETIHASHKTIQDCYDGKDIFDIISEANGQKDRVIDGLSRNEEIDSNTLFDQTFLEMKNKVEGITGVPSGIEGLDAKLGGFQNGSLIIIAARPAMGKSTLALSMAIKSTRFHKKKIGIFSLEMSNSQLMNKVISNVSDVDLWKIQKGVKYMTDHEITRIQSAKEKIKNMYWDDTASISIQELRAKAKRMKRKYGIDMLIVDYLQLMSAGHNFRGNTEAEVSLISRGLKLIAKELDIPVLALSQLSRAVETRPGNGKRPMLSDLRSSGSIEQDADVVAFIYRPEVYGNTEDENGESTIGLAELIIGKNRHGETGTVKTQFIGKYSKFIDTAESMLEAGRAREAMQSNMDFDKPITRSSTMNDLNWDNDDPF